MTQDKKSRSMRPGVKPLSVLFLALLIGVCIDANNTANAQEHVKILNRNSNTKYLAVAGADVSDGGNVILWDDIGQQDIKWSLLTQGESRYKIRNDNSGKYLAVSAGAVANGGNVIQWSDAGQRDIVWVLELQDEPYCYKIRNVNSGKYLVVSGGATTGGANVLIWQDQNQPDIVWCKQPLQ